MDSTGTVTVNREAILDELTTEAWMLVRRLWLTRRTDEKFVKCYVRANKRHMRRLYALGEEHGRRMAWPY